MSKFLTNVVDITRLIYGLKTFFERAAKTAWYSHSTVNWWVNVFNMASVVCCDVGKLLVVVGCTARFRMADNSVWCLWEKVN